MSAWDYTTAALTIPCAYCGAAVGHRCVTASGRIADYPHGARTQPLTEAFGAGFTEGNQVEKQRRDKR